MTDFDPEKFEDKYVHYFDELQRAYKNAFERMNERYDSELVHAIDQQVLNESEPFYEGGDPSGEQSSGEFRVALPENPTERVQGVLADEEKVAELLDVYVTELETELRRVFGFEE